MLTPWKETYDWPRKHIKKQRHYFTNKGPSSQGYGFPNSHVWLWELDYKDSWELKNWCFWTVVLEKTLERPLDCKEIQPVHPKGNQFWIFIERNDVEAETPILWPPDAKNWLIWKDPDAGKDWGWEEKGMTEDEMVGWHYWLNRHEFGYALGVHDRQGCLACCSPWGSKESDMTEQLNWTDVRLSSMCSWEIQVNFLIGLTYETKIFQGERNQTVCTPVCFLSFCLLINSGYCWALCLPHALEPFTQVAFIGFLWITPVDTFSAYFSLRIFETLSSWHFLLFGFHNKSSALFPALLWLNFNLCLLTVFSWLISLLLLFAKLLF